MKKVCLIVLLISTLYSAQIKSNLFEFANLVSSHNYVKIIINGDIEVDDYYFYTYEKDPIPDIKAFKKLVEIKGLNLTKVDDYYFVYKNHKRYVDKNSTNFDDELPLRYIKLEKNSFKEARNVILLFDRNSTYIAKDNAVAFRANDDDYFDITNAIKELDKKDSNQVTFKITILETNLEDIKNRGTQINSLLKGVDRGDFGFFVNLITIPYTLESNVISSKKDRFYGVLNFLDENEITKIISSPFVTSKNYTEVYFSNVKNMPFLTQSNEISEARTSKQSLYEYRDVGLKLWLKPIILNDIIDFDLRLVFEDVLSAKDSLTPTTSKKELKSSYQLRRGEVLILSGINQTIEIKRRNGIPILKDIWLLKYIFGFDSKEVKDSVLTISIEVI
ncbi:MAG: type II and III secretion system protein [Campylobacter sp.]|nr:type II and III secretion system protein [Campylobacter sp.]